MNGRNFKKLTSSCSSQSLIRGTDNSKKSLSHFSRRFLKIREKISKILKRPKNPKNLEKKSQKITKIFRKISRDLNPCHFFFDLFALRSDIPLDVTIKSI